MRTTLVLLVFGLASAAAAPIQIALNARQSPRNKDAVPVSMEAQIVFPKDATNRSAKKQSEKTDGGTKEQKSALLTSIPSQDNRAESEPDAKQKQSNESKDKVFSKKGRKHKAIFVDYPILSQLQFPSLPYDIDYADNSFDAEERTRGGSFHESNIFYIRLPPTPYMFVPGLGYISQPPTYSTSSLRPQISYARPGRPKPTYQQPPNPFIKLPIDFVSNGKPTSVYQWQKKPSKKPTDSPITNLDSLSSEFVSNGKPTTIYQWQSDSSPAKTTDDLVNNLDKGPYAFNGKPTSFFLLKSDGTSSDSQPLEFPDYQKDNAYY